MIDHMLLNKNKYSLFAKKVRVPKGTDFSSVFMEFVGNPTYVVTNEDLDLDVCAVSKTAYLVGRDLDIPTNRQGTLSTTYGPIWVPKSQVEVISGGDKSS